MPNQFLSTQPLRQRFSPYCLLLSAALWLLTAASPSWAKSMEDWAAQVGVDLNLSYSATRVMETKDGRFEFKEHAAPKKRAMEMDVGGMQGTLLMREDQEKAFFVMPEMGMYREMKLTEAMKQSNHNMDMQDIEEVGRETISGYESTKYKTTFKDKNGKGAGYIWVADAGFPIKMDMIYKSRKMKGQRMTMEMKDIEIGPVDAQHFEIPEGLKPFGLGGMFSQFGKQQRQPAAEQGPRHSGAEGQRNNEEPEPAGAGLRDGIRGLFKR